MLSWYHKLGIKVIDLLILAAALFLITSSATIVGGFFSLSFLNLVLVVVVVYLIVAVFVGFLCMSIPTEHPIGRVSKTIVTGLLIYFLFPYIINIVMFLLGYQLTADTQMILMGTAILRTVVRTFLGSQWESLP